MPRMEAVAMPIITLRPFVVCSYLPDMVMQCFIEIAVADCLYYDMTIERRKSVNCSREPDGKPVDSRSQDL